jgi:multiple sugar transport system permease protein
MSNLIVTATKQKKQKPKIKMSKREKRFLLYGLLFASPWIIGFLCFQLYPICSAVYYSFTSFNIFAPPKWIGLENYKTLLFNDTNFLMALKNTAFMAFIGMPISLIVALLIALLLNIENRFMSFFRTIYYLPTVVPIVASAMLFLWILNTEYGLVNNLFSVFGASGPAWLSDPHYTKWSLIMMDTWRCGQTVLILLASLKAVPTQFYEAASIDGANSVKRFFSITIPCISPSLQFVFIMGLITNFQYFTQAFVFASVSTMAQSITGGPGNSLLFYSLYLYKNAFNFMKMGYASAMAVILFIIIMITSFFTLIITEKRMNYDVE